MKWQKVLLLLVLGLLLVIIFLPMHMFGLLYVLLSVISGEGTVTETTDIADYGIIIGNYDNDRPAEFMFSFFPEEISEDFSNVSYHYKAQRATPMPARFGWNSISRMRQNLPNLLMHLSIRSRRPHFLTTHLFPITQSPIVSF